MKMIKVAVIFLFSAITHIAHATAVNYELSGKLTSYSLLSSGAVTPVLETLEPTTVFMNGNAFLNTDSTGTYFDLNVTPEYHVVRINNGASAVETYAGIVQKSGGMTTDSLIYDPLTNHLSGMGQSATTLGVGSYCTGITSVCAALYSETVTNGSTATFNITFGNSLDNLAGTLNVNSKLNNGDWIIRTYDLTGIAVPTPISGVLFSSALAMAGLLRRKK